MAQDARRDAGHDLNKLTKQELVELVKDLQAGRVDGFELKKFDYVIEQMLNGRSARSVFLREHEDDEANSPSKATFYRWLANSELDKKFRLKEKHDFAFHVRAMDEFDYMFEIADDGQNDWMEVHDNKGDFVGWRENGESTRRSQIRLQHRQYALSKMNKHRFSEKAGAGNEEGAQIKTKVVEYYPDREIAEDQE